MNFTKSLSYKLMTAVLALAGGAMMASCEKEETETQLPPIDVEVKISSIDVRSLFDGPYNSPERGKSELIDYYINNPQIKNIYIVPEKGTWSTYDASDIIASKQKTLIPALSFSPKIRGKGDFNFKPGEASKIPEDSLWFVQNGWTINKDLQK